MNIWHNKALQPHHINALNPGTLGEHIGLECTEVGDDYLVGTLPVDHRTVQPYGLLHGGASCVLAETLGSVASAMVVDHEKYMTLGIEINANHLRAIKEGKAIGTCRPLQLGKTLHVWEIRICDERNRLCCVSRLTMMVKERKGT
jgi:1,4-dihydroxy-2-naphthoyl-CoA hydrolase